MSTIGPTWLILIEAGDLGESGNAPLAARWSQTYCIPTLKKTTVDEYE